MEPVTGISIDNTTGTVTSYGSTGITSTSLKGVVTHFDNTALFTSSNNSLTFNNQNNMIQQVKVAVFEITRDEKGKITSSKFLKELWVEKKNGISIDLVVAKELDKNFDPQNIVVKEIYSVSF